MFRVSVYLMGTWAIIAQPNPLKPSLSHKCRIWATSPINNINEGYRQKVNGSDKWTGLPVHGNGSLSCPYTQRLSLALGSYLPSIKHQFPPGWDPQVTNLLLEVTMLSQVSSKLPGRRQCFHRKVTFFLVMKLALQIVIPSRLPAPVAPSAFTRRCATLRVLITYKIDT